MCLNKACPNNASRHVNFTDFHVAPSLPLCLSKSTPPAPVFQSVPQAVDSLAPLIPAPIPESTPAAANDLPQADPPSTSPLPLVFTGSVRSGLLTLSDMDRDLDRSTVTIKGKKTGLNRPRLQFSVHGPVLTSPGLNWFKTGLDRFFYR